MKKYFLTTFVIALFAIGFASSEASEEEKAFQGTYVLTDADGVKWTFTFKCGDPTNQVTAIREGMSEDDMYYGKWSGSTKATLVDFGDFHAGDPKLRFPDGVINLAGEHLYVSDEGWLYKGHDYLESKNPNKRIKITKQ